MVLQNWSVVPRGDDPYKAPKLQRQSLSGDVYGHPRFNDGDRIITSSVVGLDGDKIRTHSGSLYELGEVDPNYEKRFPNAKERVFAALKGEKR